MKKSSYLLILALAIPFFVTGQNYGEINQMASSAKNNFGKFNVLAGANSMSLTFNDGNGRVLNSSFPNVYGYYIGGNMYSLWSEKGNTFWAGSTEFLFGKQKVNAPMTSQLIGDSLSIYNFSKYSGYSFKAPFKAIYNLKIGNNMSWGISGGAYLSVPMMMGRIAHDGKVEDLSAVTSQYLVDYGWTAGVEFGFRAGFFNIDYSRGMSNMSEDGGGTSITDNGAISFSIGYRFETPLGEKDGEMIRNVKNNLTGK